MRARPIFEWRNTIPVRQLFSSEPCFGIRYERTLPGVFSHQLTSPCCLPIRQWRLPDLGPLDCLARILPVDLNSGGTIKSNSLIRLDSAVRATCALSISREPPRQPHPASWVYPHSAAPGGSCHRRRNPARSRWLIESNASSQNRVGIGWPVHCNKPAAIEHVNVSS
jgi:hypothetical protein